ncbi:arogenate dehydrogenase 1, chloroplastic-like [Olea europaea var. sylvestris]|uniref:arogenate dehydrogenase 1, chloroplastic-like n=1 Tax=Olea europaea var. sylvestris TaxID=158386 RepID=UPI000C1D68D2|nr:arogenate dehydrogenase 1, chloroplastic-like [Olea europaea var. sylvestris]
MHQHQRTSTQMNFKLHKLNNILGFGPFARFLAKTMVKQGHSIRATSRSDYTDLCIHLGALFFRNGDMTAFLESNNDVILLCASILSVSKVIKSIPFHALKQPALFADVLSVKEYPRDLLLQIRMCSALTRCSGRRAGKMVGKT